MSHLILHGAIRSSLPQRTQSGTKTASSVGRLIAAPGVEIDEAIE
jgi:hypothetical protein